jgi:hypothetical protein
MELHLLSPYMPSWCGHGTTFRLKYIITESQTIWNITSMISLPHICCTFTFRNSKPFGVFTTKKIKVFISTMGAQIFPKIQELQQKTTRQKSHTRHFLYWGSTDVRHHPNNSVTTLHGARNLRPPVLNSKRSPYAVIRIKLVQGLHKINWLASCGPRAARFRPFIQTAGIQALPYTKHCLHYAQTDHLTLFTVTTTVYCESYTQQISGLCGTLSFESQSTVLWGYQYTKCRFAHPFNRQSNTPNEINPSVCGMRSK